MRGRRPVLTVAPTTAAEFGQGLRALRSVGLGRLARRQVGSEDYDLVLSKSSLARYESGQVLPALEYAEHLDRLYEADGWVMMTLRSLWRPKWDPWHLDHGVSSRFHAGNWPAPYGGPVWIAVKPRPENVGLFHAIRLEWGPWERRHQCLLAEEGVVLMTGKAPDSDGVSRTCNVTTDRPVFVLFGAHEASGGADPVDVRRGWVIANEGVSASEATHGPSSDLTEGRKAPE